MQKCKGKHKHEREKHESGVETEPKNWERKSTKTMSRTKKKEQRNVKWKSFMALLDAYLLRIFHS